MCSITQAADYIIYLAQLGNKYALPPIKLQKILYYAQGYHSMWYEEYLFEERFEVGVQGPVNRRIFMEYKEENYSQKFIPNDNTNLTAEEKQTIETVWDHYRKFNVFELMEMTKSEDPWINGDTLIDNEAIKEYFIKAYK